MRIKGFVKWALGASCVMAGTAACGGDGDKASRATGNGGSEEGGVQSDGSGCTTLCTEGGYTSGDEQTFENGKLVECYCSGGTQSLSESACDSYCDAFDVPAEKAVLSTTNVPGDKCVCDGLSPLVERDAGSDAGEPSDQPPWAIDGNGFPIPPAAADEPGTGRAYVVVTNSTSTHLPNGFYETPYSKTVSGQNTLSFSEVIESKVTIRLNINGHVRAMKDETFECAMSTDVIVARGMPPGLDNDLFARTCSVKWTYDAVQGSYAGTLKASLSEDPNGAAGSATAEIVASFVWKEPAGG